jgi:hypothetical protein
LGGAEEEEAARVFDVHGCELELWVLHCLGMGRWWEG